MSSPVFLQDSRLGRAIFSVEGVCLEITHTGLIKKPARLIPLHSLSSDYVRTRNRNWEMILISLFLAGISGVLTLFASRVKEPGLDMIVLLPGMMTAVYLWWGLRSIPKVDVAAFSERSGKPAFLIARSTKQAPDFDQFVGELVSRIKAHSGPDPTRMNSPNKMSQSTASPVTPPAGQEARQP
jgi:hypothetical protein